MTTQITKAQFLSQQIEETFLSDYRELLAHFSAAAIFQGIQSFLQLNYTIEELTTAPVTPGGAYRKLLALALITLLNRNSLEPLTDLNELAEKDLDKLRRETGIDVDEISVPAPPAPTADELLAAEVRSDWKNLSSDQIRKKRSNSRAYGLMLDRLADNGSLDSQITSLRIAGS
jgi:hypothetical protein